jgi:RNA polymerase sigma factor (sigma-70 family)
VTARPFEDVLREHGAVVMRVCRALLGPVDADDAWSETLLAALSAFPDLRPDSNVRGWLVTIAHRKAIDQLRAAARAPKPVADVPDVASHDRRAVDHVDTELWDALQALPLKQRVAVTCHHVAGLPYADVAELMGVSVVAARRNAADGIARLRTTYRRGAPR